MTHFIAYFIVRANSFSVSRQTVFGTWVPYIILFVIGLVGFMAASLLPETLNTDLPQSLFDANAFLTSEKYWSYKGRRCCASTTHNRSKNSKVEGHSNVGSESITSCDKC